MMTWLPESDNEAYYDAFSATYDRGRDRGYHQLIDDQAAAIIRRVGTGKDLLEVGCGTGLILQRVATFARTAQGIDLSPKMLEHARRRGVQVRAGSATQLPFEEAAFDVVYSFKTLAHVLEWDRALKEMVRVVHPGGHIVFDVYNRHSIRYLVKHWFSPRATSSRYDESAVPTRFLSPGEAGRCLPAGTRLVARSGIRILVPHAAVCAIPLLGALTRGLEWRLMDSALGRFGGFLVFTLQKET